MSDPQKIELSVSFNNPLRISFLQDAPIRSFLKITHQGFSIIIEGAQVMYNLPVDHEVKMQVAYQDAEGNPAAIDGPVQWASSDAALATLTIDAGDNTIVTVTPVGPIGQVQVTATADADLGTGVRSLLTTADITLVAGEAVSGTIQPVGAPTPKP